MKIAAVVMERLVNGIYRTWIPMQALAYRGHTVHVEERDIVARPDLLLDFDVVHLCRALYDHMEQLTVRLRRAGVAIVWDNDDDLTAIPRELPAYRQLGGAQGQRILSSMRKMMRTADIVTTPSSVLADRYRALSGADVRVLENYLPPTFVPPQRVSLHEGLVIGWHGASEHHIDVDRLGIAKTLEELLRRHRDLRVMSIGVNLRLSSRHYEHRPWMTYSALPDYLSHIDIGIAPICDLAFNRARSNIKLKEYAAMGVPWLASPIGPYVGMGAQQGGRLVADDCWRAELERLIVDADGRRRLAQQARRWAATQRIEAHVEQWERVFADAIACVASPVTTRH